MITTDELREFAAGGETLINYVFSEPHIAISARDALLIADRMDRIRALEAAGHGLSGCLKILFLRGDMPEGVEMALYAWQKAIGSVPETACESNRNEAEVEAGTKPTSCVTSPTPRGMLPNSLGTSTKGERG